MVTLDLGCNRVSLAETNSVNGRRVAVVQVNLSAILLTFMAETYSDSMSGCCLFAKELTVMVCLDASYLPRNKRSLVNLNCLAFSIQ